MKLTIIFLTITALQVSAKGYGQGITLSLKDVTIKTAFYEIRKQAPGFDFFYEEDWLKDAKKVSIDVKNASLKEVLEQCFKNQPFSYSVTGSLVTIQKKKPSLSYQTNEDNLVLLTVYGVLLNEKNETVSGATIRVKGTDKFTTSDENGRFTIRDVDEKADLEISHISYQPLIVAVNSSSKISVVLKAKIGSLDLVTVNTGYKIYKPNELTGSVVVLDENKLDERIAPDIVSKLEGITNGLVFNKTVDGQNSIRVRGENTIFANASPLIVIDNFPYDGNINNINPNDVESITLLKDAAAASIWGVQAGNGVIVITTKKGKRNQPLKIELNSNYTTTQKPDVFHAPQISSFDYIDFEKYLFEQGYFDGPLSDYTLPPVSHVVEILNDEKNGLISHADATSEIDNLRNVDFRNDIKNHFLRPATLAQEQVNFSGGADNTTYYLSLGYDKNKFSNIGNSSNRISINSQNTFRFTKWLESSLGISHFETNNRPLTQDLARNAYPYTKLFDGNSNQLNIPQHREKFEDTIVNHGFNDWKYYPLQEASLSDSRTKVYETRLNASLKAALIKGLNVSLTYQYLKTLSNTRSVTPEESYFMRDNFNTFPLLDTNINYIGTTYPKGGQLDLSNTSLVGQYGRADIELVRKFGIHAINLFGGFEAREIKGENNTSRLYGYDDETGSFIVPDLYSQVLAYPYMTYGYLFGTPGSGSGLRTSATLSRFRSYFGNLSYTIANKYTFTGSARWDGTNYFGVNRNKKTVPLWSSGIKWQLSDESFYNFKGLPKLSLRLTYGYNGNLAQNLAAITTFRFSKDNSAYSGLPFAVVNNIPNPNLSWEKTSQFNVGIDFASKNNRVTGSFEYFEKRGVDLIGFQFIDPTTGVQFTKGNFSALKSKGIDLQLGANLIDAAFKWNASLIFNYAADKITKFEAPPAPLANLEAYSSVYPQVGKPLYSLFSYNWAGLDPNTGDPRVIQADTVMKDYGSSGFEVSDLVYSGRYNPPINGSWYNTFSYRGFSLSVNVIYKLDYYFRRPTIVYSRFPNGYKALHSDFSNRWMKPGDEAFTNVPSLTYPFDATRDRFYSASTALVTKGDHIRLQYVNLAYDFSNRIVRKVGLQGIRLYFYANNIGIIWRANKYGIEPDYPYITSPSPLSFSFGTKITL